MKYYADSRPLYQKATICSSSNSWTRPSWYKRADMLILQATLKDAACREYAEQPAMDSTASMAVDAVQKGLRVVVVVEQSSSPLQVSTGSHAWNDQVILHFSRRHSNLPCCLCRREWIWRISAKHPNLQRVFSSSPESFQCSFLGS